MSIWRRKQRERERGREGGGTEGGREGGREETLGEQEAHLWQRTVWTVSGRLGALLTTPPNSLFSWHRLCLGHPVPSHLLLAPFLVSSVGRSRLLHPTPPNPTPPNPHRHAFLLRIPVALAIPGVHCPRCHERMAPQNLEHPTSPVRNRGRTH
ncbi:hypothetical protein HJG60_007769 [Phyllostomus discolor]|uniref:Uncharacterized protein n=1 Tax=Phyllostomus discolor TaxID=89673 RepID=A0A834EVF8_9CHIR|nr:hypothetical protein HJG60_007769 [Phyllostomus discolor]